MLPIGTQINRWIIIGKLYSEGNRKYYPCRCLCGHEQRVRNDNLIRGHSQSHRGCKWKGEIPQECIVEKQWIYKADVDRTEEDIHLKNSYLGCFFGNWLTVAVDHSDKYGHTYYRCLNDKGNAKVVRYDKLTNEYGFPEGKYNPFIAPKINSNGIPVREKEKSVGEQAIKNFLIMYNIPYEQEYIFPDLMGDKACLRFDFKIEYNNQIILIEFQGKQHYEPVEFFGGQERFKLQQRYDSYKRAYCAAHGYKLIEIPYTDIDKINKYLNFLQKNKEEA